MGRVTTIQWADHTFNGWWGCTKVSRACKRCYAATFAARWLKWGADVAPRVLSDRHWLQPLAWSSAAKRAGVRRRVFCSSMADVFERRDNEHGPTLDRLRARLFETIEAADGLDWQLLTKRPENMQAMAPASWRSGWPAHVWAGATVENQATAEERIPHLLAVPAAIRFLSCEPMTGAIDLEHVAGDNDGFPGCWSPLAGQWWPALGDADAEFDGRQTHHGRIGWVIAGGESGPGAEPTYPGWIRDLRDQCDRASVPFFFKQWGDWRHVRDAEDMDRTRRMIDHEGRQGVVRDLGRTTMMVRTGKALAGRLLDGREHNAFPVSAAA